MNTSQIYIIISIAALVFVAILFLAARKKGNQLTHWIKNHQVLAFFLMAYAISWSGIIFVYFIFPGNLINVS